MRHSDYEEMLTTQSVHWWFEGKRRVINSIISKKIIPHKNSHILEIGSGTGSNLPVLSQYGNVTAMELDYYARETIRIIHAQQKSKAGSLTDSEKSADKLSI